MTTTESGKPREAGAGGDKLLEVHGLSKTFPGVRALDRVDFSLRRGEIHALLGGNGAGKSTLIRILGGIETPDAGSLRLDGRELPRGDIGRCLGAGIRVIHQEICVANNLTVAENLLLGVEPRRAGLLIDRKALVRRAERRLADLGFPLQAGERVGDLPVGRRQLVEIARALGGDAVILILDEPTAALDEAESASLFREVRRLRDRGIGVIYITHRLEEVFDIADRVTVLRDGRSVFTSAVADLSQDRLIEEMVAGKLRRGQRRSRTTGTPVLLEVEGLSTDRLREISFTLGRGEVLGLAGQMGSGRSELGRALAGIDRVRSGRVRLEERRVRLRTARDAIRHGIVLVPEDRRGQGLFPALDVRFHLTLPDISSWQNLGITNARRRDRLARGARERLDIRARISGQPVSVLSGGNQQKVVIGKWLGSPRKVLILDDPARGVDVAAKEEIFAIVEQLSRDGMGVIFISSELPEVLRVSDRILVLRQGRVHAAVDARSATAAELTRLAAGHPPSAATATAPSTATTENMPDAST